MKAATNRPTIALNGLLIIDKPAGLTSHDVVQWARRHLGTRRIGHTGTLDPLATGVLVLCIEKATRLAEYLSAARKAYRAEVVFGMVTDSFDITGQILHEQDASHLTKADVEAALERFRGTILQVPPMVSAKRYQGRRLYELARQGHTVERQPLCVQIERLNLLDFRAGERPVATLEVVCSSGTYIRSLAADLGETLGVGGTMQSLRRMWVGQDAEHAFTLEQAYTLPEIERKITEGTVHEALLPLTAAFAGRCQLTLSEEQAYRIRHGQALSLEAIGFKPSPSPDAVYALLDANGNFIGVGRIEENRLQPVKVLYP